MILVEKVLLLLPVHRCLETVWHSEVDAKLESMRSQTEKVYGKPFDKLRPALQAYLWDSELPPPWLLNDLIGWVVIGSDGGDCLCGDLYCRRKDLRPADELRRYGSGSPGRNNHWVHWAELGGRRTRWCKDNSQYVEAVTNLVSEATKSFRERWPRWRRCEVWLPSFSLDCLDWAWAMGLRGDDGNKERGRSAI